MEMVLFVACRLGKKKKTFDVSAMYFFLILTSFTSLHVVFGEGSKNFTENVKSLENYRKSLFWYWWFVYFESFYTMLSSFQWKDLSVSFFYILHKHFIVSHERASGLLFRQFRVTELPLLYTVFNLVRLFLFR